MSVESVPAMSREEFEHLFRDVLNTIEPWKLKSVAEHMMAVAREYRSPNRKQRVRRQRKPKTPRPDRREEYEKYMKSVEWRDIRMIVLERDLNRCLCCGDPATEVHHRSYSPRVMAGQDNAKLVSICGRCHNRIHYNDDNQKRGKKETDKAYKALVAARDERSRRVSSRSN